MALTKISGEVVGSSITIGIVTANTINVGSAVTIHTRGFQVGTSDLHSTGLNLGSGNIISHNINSTGTISASSINVSGIITATQFVTGTSGSAIGINTNTISGPETITIDPAAIGDNTGLVVIKGDLQIDGTTTTINSTTLTVDDKNIVLGSGAANDAAADGSGITIESGNGNKTFQFEDTGDNLGSSENLNVASGKVYKVNNTSVLSSTTLGSGVVNSSLTSVGTLTNLNVGNVNSSGIVTATTFVGALTGNAATVTTNANLTGDVTSTGNATAIAAGVIVNADINASAGIVDTKLATISTAGKVSNSATTATNANTGSAIVARDASGNFSAGTITATLSGNSTTATNLSTSGGNWSTNGTISAVVGQLAWKNYGNSHTIFDASNGTSPAGGAVNNTNSGVAWVATYPTLMGWNGSNTYGVRVDSARISDSTSGSSASVANAATFNSGGAGAVSGTTFNGSAAQTISYNTIGASPLAGSSSLVTTGTVTSGTWSGSFGAVSGANLTSLTAGNLSGTIPSGVLGNSTHYVGTTAILLNRASASQSLTGINIDGSSGSVTGLTLNSSVSPINPDNVTQNQLGYNNSVSLFGQIDGGLYSSAYSSSWIHQIYGDFRTGQIAIRGKNNGTWQAWRTVLDSSNYTSYVGNGTLTLAVSGTGLSGSASFTANQSGATTFTVTSNATSANTASAIVARDGNGDFSGRYISSSYFNSSDDVSTGTITYLMGKFGDNYYRSATAAKVAAFISGQTMNISGSSTSCSGNAATATTATTATNQSGGTVSATTGSFSSTVTSYSYQGNGNVGGTGSASWHPSGIYSAGNNWLYGGINAGGSSVTNMGDARANIFYDYNDTAYYTDPASTSNLNSLTLNGSLTVGSGASLNSLTLNGSLTVGSGASSDIYMTDTDEGTRRIHCNSNRIGFLNQDAGWGSYCSDNGDWTTDTISYAGASFRAPIFYDSNNTAYYIDPAGTTILADTKINFVSGAGGHSFAASHYSMGKDIANTGWSHPHYSDLIIGYHTGIRIGAHYSGIRFYNNSPTTDANNDGNGDVGEALLMTVGGYVGTANYTDVVVNNNLFANASMRSPIFYDSDNTGCYVDPASTSNLNNVQANSFGVGTAASGTAGEIRATNNITAYYSDERLKENIKPISSALSKLLTLRGVTFNSNEIAEQYGYTDKKEQVGVIAQDVEKILPQIVVPAPFDIAQDEDGNEYSKSGENYKTVHYDKLVPLLIEAIKEQQIQINYLKNIIINKSSN
jgi:hypothetical protein